MDVHIIPGVKARDVAEAHQKDLLLQNEHGCKCMTYWIDEERENVFCLIEAPGKEVVEELHSKAHGLIPNKIIEVNSEVVHSFLGRIYDPENAEISPEGLKVFHDPSFRILMITKMTDPVLLQYRLGIAEANKMLSGINELIRKNLSIFEGREVEHTGNGYVISFDSASKAVSCALAIQKEMPGEEDEPLTSFRIGINGGEPVNKSENLFGDTIQMANYICSLAKQKQVAVAASVSERIAKDHFYNKEDILSVSPQDEAMLESLFSKLENSWQDENFSVGDYCHAMNMSKSQLYRKTVELCGLSPNSLLKEFRLEKAKDLMKKRRYTISQITFDSGFTSPSYFTKCFKKKYGLLPMHYLDLLH